MHNGSVETLEDVIDFYNKGGITRAGTTTAFPQTKSELIRPLGLTKEEKQQLLAFLDAFSGEKLNTKRPTLPPYEPLFSEQDCRRRENDY